MLNLTPHHVTIRVQDGSQITLWPCGSVARVATKEAQAGSVNGVPVIRREFGEVEGLPVDGTPCLVSSIVLAALPAGTPGVYAPDTGPTAIRNEKGQVVAVTRLVAA